MSRTLRNIINVRTIQYDGFSRCGNSFYERVDESKAKAENRGGSKVRKMKAYVKLSPSLCHSSSKWNFKDVNKNINGLSFRSRTGFGARQSARNYNRSLRKGLRQQLKNELKQELENSKQVLCEK